jgi:hypothetical protein
VNQLLPQLYLHGLVLGDFDLALRGLLGQEAPISAGTIAWLKEQWQQEWQVWRQQVFQGDEFQDGIAVIKQVKVVLVLAQIITHFLTRSRYLNPGYGYR